MLYYIIDGYNVTESHKDRFPGNARESRDLLIKLIKETHPEGSSRNRVTVVFDGQPGVTSPREKELDVRFTKGREADWKIKEMVKAYRYPARILVVTDDRALIHHITALGARSLSTAEFVRRLFAGNDGVGKVKPRPEKEFSPEFIKEVNREIMEKLKRKM